MTTYAFQESDLLLDNKKYVLKIRDLPQEDKPREKLLALGPPALSVSELLALVLNTGTKKEGVLAMTSRVIKEYGERALSRHNNPVHLSEDLNIPLSKAVQIVACAELGKRFYQKDYISAPVIRTPQDVYDYLADMRALSKEHLRGLYLNSHYKVIHDEVISIGTINSNLIHPREVFKPAIEYSAVAVILAHNHPSGVVDPSTADVEVTTQLIEAGKIIGIHIIDHIIIGKSSFKSIISN